MRKMTRIISFVLMLLCIGTNAYATECSQDTKSRMGTFISNFTEVAMSNLPDAQNLPDEQYAYFGVRHLYINGYRHFKDEGNSRASVEASLVESVVMRYFGKKMTKHLGVPDSEIQYDSKTKRYSVPLADGEMAVHAKVEKVTQNADKTLTLSGKLYNADDVTENLGSFTAKVKPHKWKGRNTWALLSLISQRKN